MKKRSKENNNEEEEKDMSLLKIIIGFFKFLFEISIKP